MAALWFKEAREVLHQCDVRAAAAAAALAAPGGTRQSHSLPTPPHVFTPHSFHWVACLAAAACIAAAAAVAEEAGGHARHATAIGSGHCFESKDTTVQVVGHCVFMSLGGR